MKIGKKFAIILAVVIGLAGASAANAHFCQGPMKHGMGQGFPGLRMVMALDLSDTQRDEIRNIIKKYRAEGQDMRKQLASAREKITAVMFADQLDEEAVRSRIQEIAPLMEDLAVLGARIISEVKTVLTADQIDMLKDMRAECTEKRGRFRKSHPEYAVDNLP
ncbi:MAG: Spy/CpxP family protein refolding chaperone [Deltaproteobacteria bacterium]|nr:Spy/CpxP family protein refolding chaperone [Deltaproteobacteria bacterium]MBW2593569.1 Spy/CpxP family protein refolding chaperone [Deltaproteobacteria bacterium]